MPNTNTQLPYQDARLQQEFAVPDYAAPDTAAYAVPDISEGGPYTTAPGWAPNVGEPSPASTPDPYRLGGQPVRQMRPAGDDTGDSDDPSGYQGAFYHSLDAEKASRHSVEYQDADGWAETKDYPGYPSAAAGFNRWAPNPRATPPPEPRPTTLLAPHTYTFTRPFMTGLAKMGSRALTGMHFSMADHRRTYEIYGTEPVKSRRNTYRINPGPWDANLVDMPAQNVNAPSNAPQAVAVPTVDVPYTSRNWRLS